MGDTLTITIGGNQVTVKDGSFKFDDALNQRSSVSFTVLDPSGTLSFPFGSQVSVTSAVNGLLFTGLLADDEITNYYPNLYCIHKITCVDNHWFADKLYFRKTDYKALSAGAILCDIFNTYLLAENILANMVYRLDTTQAAMAQGTLTNVVATNTISTGDIELAPAGSIVTIAESGTTFTTTGTNNGIADLNGGMVPNYQNCLHLQGTSMQGVNNGNNYCYITIWSGSVSVGTGYTLNYGIWLSSKNPNQVGGVDITFTDGSNLRSTPASDQNGIAAHPGTDLSGYATDRRYYRAVSLAPVVGKTIASVQVALEGDPAGTYDVYIDSISIQTGGTPTTIYQNGNPQMQQMLSNIGYSNVSLTVVNFEFTGLADYGQRISPAYSLASVGIAKDSLVTWQQGFYPAPPTQTTATTTATGTATNSPPPVNGPNGIPYLTIESSLDGGATWQLCTNHQPIPGLNAGMNLTGVSIMFRQTVYIAGPDPSITPMLLSITCTVQPSYQCSKTDLISTQVSSTDFGSNNTNCMYNGAGLNTYPNGLTLDGYARNFDSEYGDSTSGMSLWGTSPTMQSYLGSVQLGCAGGGDVRARMDFAGLWGSVAIEVDVYLSDAVGNLGVVYHCDQWGNGVNSYAYNAFINTSSVTLGKGSDTTSGSGTFVQIATVALTLAAGQWYHLTVINNGTNHKVYVDGVLYINATDSTYTSLAGYVGLRHYNSSSSTHTALFRNFGVNTGTYTGTHLGPSLSLTNVGTVGNSIIQWTADVPSNCSLQIQTSIDGGSTWQTCTSGQPIPNLTAGMSVAGKTLQYKATLTTGNASAMPVLQGITLMVQAQFNATGSRVSPALSLSGVSRAGAANISWNANVPTNTAVYVDSSLDGTTWTQLGSGSSGDVSIAGITTAPGPTQDTFANNDSTAYTSSAMSGGATATWTWDTTNSRLIVTGGSEAVLTVNALSAISDIDLLIDIDYSDSGGMTWRQSATSGYELAIHDASAATSPNTAILYRTTGGVRSTITSVAISFTRATYHRFRVTMLGGAITVQMDGVQILSYTDSSPLPAGYVGLRTDGGTARFYQLWIQPQGQLLSSSGGAPPVISKIQSAMAASSGTVTSQTITLSSGVTAGNLLVATVSTGAYNTAITPPSGWSQAVQDNPTSSSNNNNTGIWYAIVGNNGVAAGTTSFSFTLSAAHNCYIDLIELHSSTGWPTSPVDVTAIGNPAGGTATALTSGTTPTTASAVEVWNASFIYNGTPQTESNLTSGWTRDNEVTDGTNHTANMCYQIASSVGAVQCGFSIGTAEYWSGAVATFQPNASSGGTNVYNRVRLSSTDPTQTPQITSLIMFVADNTIGAGVQVDSTNYKNTSTIASAIDDLAKRSLYFWKINRHKQLIFQQGNATPAPFVIQATDEANSTCLVANLKVKNSSPTYRNRSVIEGGQDTVAQTETRIGDGVTQTWVMAYPIANVPTITINNPAISQNGQLATVGIAHQDTGKQFYYTPGRNEIIQDTTLTPPGPTETMTFAYEGQVPVEATYDDTTEQANFKAIEGGSGIVEVVESINTLSLAGAQALAQSRVQQYELRGKTLTFTTTRDGLAIGQQTSVFIPQLQLNNQLMLIDKISLSQKQLSDGSLLNYYTVEAVSGPVEKDWTALYVNA